MTRISPNVRRLALGALLAACSLLPPAFSQPPTEPADPLPIKRVPVAPERVGQEMERLGLTALERLPLDDFDGRLRRARAAARSAPQLVEARYFRAELSGDALVGKGEWKILHSGTEPAVLPLQPLTVAVRQLRFDTRDALLAEFEGQATGLLVEGLGEQTVNFDWSARQEPGTDGVQFQLGLPACAVASLELDLPANLIVAADGLPVTGPLPADKPDLKRWRVTFSGRPSLALTLRRRPGAAEPRVLLAGHLLTRQKLTPDAVEVDFAFDHLKVQSGEFRELTCALDPSLRPHDVTAPDLDSWSVREPSAPGGPALLTVRLREPLLSGSLVIRCLAPLGAVAARGGPAEPQPWAAPGVRLLDVVPGGETLLLQVHPDVSLEAWEPGGFRLVEARGDGEGQTLRLVGGLIDGGDGKPASAPKPVTRPSARMRARGTDFRARQVALWKADPERASFIAQVNYEVLRGRLFRLPLELPAEYDDIESIATSPPRLMRNWETKVERGKTILFVDLAQPLVPEARLRLTVRLRQSTPRPGALAWAIPDLVPLGTPLREGGLAIDFDQQRFEGQVVGAALTAAPPDEDGPWGGDVPDYYGTYRGEPLRGRLELRPLPPRIRAHAAASVVVAPGRAAVETTLQLQAEAGTPQSLDVYVSAPVAGTWEWKIAGGGNAVGSFERLPALVAAAQLHVLAAQNAFEAAALLGTTPRGEWRRLTLRRPMKPRESLTLQAVTDLTRGPDARWDVPLLAVPGTESGDAEVVLYLAGADLVQIDAPGLREAQQTAGRAGPVAPWRTFRYAAFPVALSLRGPSPAPDRTAGAAIDRASLITTVEPDGRLVHLFRFQAWGWHKPALPLRLPAGAQLLSVKVNGLWVDRVPPIEEEVGGLRVDLPVPDRGGAGEVPLRRYEVVYATDGAAGWLWSRPEAPLPGLPLPPLAFVRRWRLPPGVGPLHDGRVRPLPSVAAERDEPAPDGKYLGALSSLVLRPLALEEWEERQRQQIAAAARTVRPPPGRALTLGDALEQVACDLSAEHLLVIDAPALQEAGLGPRTALAPVADGVKDAAPFWEALGLVHVPCRTAALLTTRRWLDAWQAAGRDAGSVPPSVEAAVAEAAASGHDTSGRFLWALTWARRGGSASRPVPGLPPFDPVAPGWTEWEPMAGSASDADLILVRRAPVRAAGVALAVGLIVAFWGLRRKTIRQRLALLLLWVAVAGGGLLWLPASLGGLAWAPLLVGTAVGLAWYLWSAARPVATRAAPSARSGTRATAAAGLLALVAGASLIGQAAPPGAPRTTVLVVDEAPDRQVVLAPRDLLKQVDALATAGAPRGAVIAGATYEGKAAGDAADFEARLLVHSFENGPVTLTLPFADVRLQDDGLLDGTRAFLVAAPGGQTGFVLKVEKPGAHVLVMHFRVPVTPNDSEREVRFRVPKVPQSQLSLAVPPNAAYFQALVRQGSLTRAEPAPGVAQARYTIDLGRTDAPLVFRWHEEATAPPAPALRVREAYLWSLRSDAASLSAVLHYTVTRGAPTSLVVEVPEGLEVQAVEARSAETGRPAPALKPWRVESADGKRRLRLDFAAPLTRGVYLMVRLVPLRPLAPLANLPLPTPVGAQFGGGFLAYRAEGVEVHVANSGRLRGPYGGAAGAAESKAFADLWLAAGEGSLPSLPAPHALQREPGGDPFLQVGLRVTAPLVRGYQEVSWRIGARQADLRAVARLTAPGGDLSLVEWEVPIDVVVTRVGGHDGRDPVWHWSRGETRVQAWLDPAATSAEVELDGWKKLPPEKDGARFDLPAVRLLPAQAVTTSVRLTAAADFGLTPEETSTLLPLPDSRASERELSYRPRGPAYGGRFHVHRVAAGAEARILTIADIVEGQLTFTSHIECRADGGGRPVEVRLRHWAGEARLDARDPGRRAQARRAGEEQSWMIDLPPSTGSATLTLSGTMRLPAEGVAFPNVTVSGAARVDRWFAVSGRGLATDGAKQLTALPAMPRGGPDLPLGGRVRVERLLGDGGSLWKVEGADWALRLVPRQHPGGAAPVRVALTERASAVVDGRRWAHEAVVWLYHEANTDLNVALPSGARLLGVTVDGLAVTPLQASAESLLVPLPGAGGARRVRLRWAFDPGSESLDRPRLQRPRLPGAIDGPVVWTVHVPADYTASFGSGQGHGRMTPSGPAALDLARAEAQYRLSVSLTEEAPGPAPAATLALAQRRFYQYCRYAEAGRLLTASGAGAVNLQGQGFDEWLKDLREKDRTLATEQNFEEVRARAERDAAEAAPLALEPAPGELPELAGVGLAQAQGPRGDPLPERGTPLRWQTGPEAEAPSVVLTALSDQQTKRAAGASLLLAVLLVLVWALAHFPGAVAWVRAFWPEQVALLGCLGWQTYGPALPLLFLIVLGVTARLLFMGRRLLTLLHRPPADSVHPASTTSGMTAEPRPSGS